MISIVCPIFNEDSNISEFFTRTTLTLKQSNVNYELVFINDASTDNSLQTLINLKEAHSEVRILNFSRNFGKESALSAGLVYAKGEAVIPIDADLQDPPELIPKLIERWLDGYDVVLAKRTDRKSDHPAKRISANLFYKFHNMISPQRIPENVGDFRLISRRVVDEINKLPENQRFMKGIFSWVGYKTTSIDYERQKRSTGQSSFNAWSLWNFALDGLTSFSTTPLRLWLYIGAALSLTAFILGSYIIFDTISNGISVPGYASLMVVVLFLGGIQLVSIGVLGEYIGRIYMESKGRPSYIVEREY
jgi:glycosyltransferase involved in cell wall biosynthesis